MPRLEDFISSDASRISWTRSFSPKRLKLRIVSLVSIQSASADLCDKAWYSLTFSTSQTLISDW